MAFDLIEHLDRQKKWSFETFGPGPNLEGLLEHIRAELKEIEAKPFDLEEWIDVVILAFDGAYRQGHSSRDIAWGLFAKQCKNEGRRWPDWRYAPAGQPIEHLREGEES